MNTAHATAAALLALHPTARTLTPTGDPNGNRIDWIVGGFRDDQGFPYTLIERSCPAGSLRAARATQRAFRALRA